MITSTEKITVHNVQWPLVAKGTRPAAIQQQYLHTHLSLFSLDLDPSNLVVPATNAYSHTMGIQAILVLHTYVYIML